MRDNTPSFPQQLRHRIAEVEKRDWELWILSLGTVVILTAGVVLLVVPQAVFSQQRIHLEANLSPQLAVGLAVLIMLLITYLVQKQVQIRRLRHQSIVDAWNHEISHVRLLIDPLTQVLNRCAIEEILSKEIKRAKRNETTLVLLYIDVDEFKQINTRFGHLSGDLILAEVAGLLSHSVRGCDYVIRMGGDEFLLVLVDTDRAGAEIVKLRIDRGVADWNRHSPLVGFTLRLSIGVQQFDTSKSLDEVLAQADMKMYAEKGRDITPKAVFPGASLRLQ